MEKPNEKPERVNIIASQREAEVYTGALWRKPTQDELEELATFFAEEEIDGDIRIFGEEMDEVEELIAVSERKVEILEELTPLTMVQDLVALDIQIFYTFYFLISATEVTSYLSFQDGMCKMIKQDGKLKSHIPGEFLFAL